MEHKAHPEEAFFLNKGKRSGASSPNEISFYEFYTAALFSVSPSIVILKLRSPLNSDSIYHLHYFNVSRSFFNLAHHRHQFPLCRSPYMPLSRSTLLRKHLRRQNAITSFMSFNTDLFTQQQYISTNTKT
ncbi:unnamed protein product [Vicia faba]|uniref:Uncharacterized protein n=1 Tax=Vicia faba TaxID=3906 RepID=A0AAV0YSJ5_VICFA|nr:unnamed protein product [Vicia faba]